MSAPHLNLSQRLAAAERIARDAGALAKQYFDARDQLEIETKRVLTDMVSKADREVEDLIRARLTTEFPEDAQLGEEHGLSSGTSGLTWVVDPIDGTAPYLNGLPGWCVSIGLVDDSGPLLGVIFAPELNEMYVGGHDHPTTLNGKPTRVTDRFDLYSGLLGVGVNDRVGASRLGRLYQDLAEAGVSHVRYGSGALMLAFVAAGRLIGYCEPRMSMWDCAAAYALIEAAGGKVLPFGHGAMDSMPFGVLAATPSDFDRLIPLTRFDAPDWDPQAA